MAVSAGNSSQSTYNYIYQLPYLPRRDLTRILDDNNQWKELGGVYMKYDVTTLNYFGRSESPTDSLLTDWSQKNHTIKDLFILLSHMQHLRAMEVLKPYVESKYHALCDNSECGITRLLKIRLQNNSSTAQAVPTQAPIPLPSSSPGASNGGKGVDSCNFNTPQSERNLPCKLASFHMDEKQKKNSTNGSSSRNENTTASFNDAGTAHPVSIPEAAAPSPRQSPASSPSSLDSTSSMANILHIEEAQLAQATRNWNTVSILGRGGFGTVYKGVWMCTEVAIKRMENKGLAGAEKVALQQSMGELRILNAIRHDNILPLYGYSLDGTYPCLVYEFMPNGSLEDRLMCRQGTVPLSWRQRLNIARGTARGLNFLHSRSTREKPLIHGDIKSGNILLDKAFDPKIGDFGLAREGPQTQYTHIKVSRVHGTRPYLPDEYLRGRKISTKVDTYSFGIVVFELGTGLRAYEESRDSPYLRDHVENSQLISLRDIKAGQEFMKLYEPLMSIGIRCSHASAKDRPEMKTVMEHLDQLAAEAEWQSSGSHALNNQGFPGTSPCGWGSPVNGNYPMNEAFLSPFQFHGNLSRLPFQVVEPPKTFVPPPFRFPLPSVVPAPVETPIPEPEPVPRELATAEGPDLDKLLANGNSNVAVDEGSVLPDISGLGLNSSNRSENGYQTSSTQSSNSSSSNSRRSSRSYSSDRETEEDNECKCTTNSMDSSGFSTSFGRTATSKKDISFLQK